MSKKRRLSPNKLAEERANFENLKVIPDYRSQKPEYEVAAIQAVETELDDAIAKEARLVAELAETRDIVAEKGTEFAEKMDGAATQVAAQFGEDSPQYQSVGRKRKSERGTRGRGGSGQSGNTP